MERESDLFERGDVVPVEPDHSYDKPASGFHTNHGAALNVPVSEGPADTVFDRGPVPDTDLIAAEPRVEPLHQMEAGCDPDDPAVRARLRALDVPIHQPDRLW